MQGQRGNATKSCPHSTWIISVIFTGSKQTTVKQPNFRDKKDTEN